MSATDQRCSRSIYDWTPRPHEWVYLCRQSSCEEKFGAEMEDSMARVRNMLCNGRWRVTRRGSGNIWWGICKGKSGVWREKEELGDVVGIYASGNLSTNSLQMWCEVKMWYEVNWTQTPASKEALKWCQRLGDRHVIRIIATSQP